MLDLKVINSVVEQLEQERGIPKEKVVEAIEEALAAAYKKEYGKKSQIIKAGFDLNSGKVNFYQVKIVVDDISVKMEETPMSEGVGVPTSPMVPSGNVGKNDEEDKRIHFNAEHHILIDDAKKIKKDIKVGDEMIFPLEERDDYGRISAQTAKQMIIQKIREAEKVSVYKEFEEKEGEIVNGTVQRIERGNIFVDLGRITGILPYEEQIAGERFRQGERIRAYLYSVEETPRGIYLRLSRSRPEFLKKLFEIEAPEVASGVVQIKAVAREPGSRSKIAVDSNDKFIDPVGSCVGQRGVRVSTVMSELGGEKIDIIEWSEDAARFVEDALSPARVVNVKIDEAGKKAVVKVTPDQQSLAIGRGGQNVRLAAKLTGWKIDIQETTAKEEDEALAAPAETKRKTVRKKKKIEETEEPAGGESGEDAPTETGKGLAE